MQEKVEEEERMLACEDVSTCGFISKKTQTKGNWLLSAQSIILADDDMGYTYNRSSLKTS